MSFNLAVSNIAYTGNYIEFLKFVHTHTNVSGIELAPAKLNTWDKLSENDIKAFSVECNARGLKIPAYQGVLFEKPELQLFQSNSSFAALKEHFKKLARYSEITETKSIVLGAPNNRLLSSNLAGKENQHSSSFIVERFLSLSESIKDYNVTIVLESIPSQYGERTFNSYKYCQDIVKAVNHKNLGMHLDTACVELNGDSIYDSIIGLEVSLLHFHVTQPNLGNFSEPESYHKLASKALREISYDNWLSIEMKPCRDEVKGISDAIDNVVKIYS